MTVPATDQDSSFADQRDPEIRLPNLEAKVSGDPIFHAVSPQGLLTLTLRGAQLPEELLQAVYRFRLLQYLHRGWADAAAVAARGLNHEPYDQQALHDFHTLVVERESGRLRGYGTLAVTRDADGTLLSAVDHRPFVVERDYGLRLADYLGPKTPAAAVGEGKRLVRDWAMSRSQAAASVPWWVYLGWAHACLQILEHPGGAIVGDGKKNGAVHQLQLLGFHTRTLDVPALAPDPDDLFAPMWNQRERSYPFILTDSGELHPTLEYLSNVLASDDAGSIRASLTSLRETTT
ncbi:hypothetical protein ACX6XY_20015 [Streptomyces sp. O3]